MWAKRRKTQGAKERGNEKETFPPSTPIEKKQGGKKPDGDGDTSVSLRPRARAHARERLDANGVADPVTQIVDEAVRFCDGTPADRLIWLKMCNRNCNSFLGVLMEFECDVESHPQHRLDSRVKALQARLNRVLPMPKGGAV